MLATLTGDLCLLVGLAVLLLPLLATELSRPRDGAWGAVVLLLGLVLVTSNDRLRGAPMLAVACGALLIGRLGSEVAQARWLQLSPEEQQRLSSRERWASSLQQLIAVLASLGSTTSSVVTSFKPASQATPAREGASRSGKRWVRPESPSTGDTPQDESAPSDAINNDTEQTTAEQGQAKQAPTNPTEPAAALGEDTSRGFGKTKAKGTKKGKRWVRPESAASPPPPTQESAQEPASEPADVISAEATTVATPDATLQQPEPAPEEPQSTENSDAAPPPGTGQD